MTRATTAQVKAYKSGWCATGQCDRCRGEYAGVPCCCEHHQAEKAEK